MAPPTAGAAWPDGVDQSRVEQRRRTELSPSSTGPVVAGDTLIVGEAKVAAEEN